MKTFSGKKWRFTLFFKKKKKRLEQCSILRLGTQWGGWGFRVGGVFCAEFKSFSKLNPLFSDIQSCLFTIYCGSEGHSPPEQTVQLREKNSHSVPRSLWQCLDYKSGDSI